MVRSFLVKAFAALALVAVSSPAFAATIIDFRNGGAAAGGTITFDGADVFGSNLPIGVVEIFGADINNGVFNVNGSVSQSLRFDENGNLIGDGNYGSLDFNTQTDVVTLSGCIPGLGVGMVGGVCTPVTLLTGTITAFDMNTGAGGLTEIEFDAFDTKNPDLLIAIGLPPTTPFVVDTFALLTGTLDSQGDTAMSISHDVRNVAVPEPATMMLLGTGLLAAFRARRRQA